MDFANYQAKAHKTAVYPHEMPDDLVPLWYSALGLCGEAGEFANKVKKILRDQGGELTSDVRVDLMHELGGVLWYVAEACTMMGMSLEGIANENITQLSGRAQRGTLHGSGDDR